jgi:hypothetical protein
MAIRTGIGVGAAQIADTSGIMNAYAKQVAQQQRAQALQAEKQAKEDAAYNEKLADLLSDVKTDGARDVDIPDITKSYNELKEMYRQGLSIKDPAERALYRANLNKGVSSLNEYAQRSKKFAGDLFGVSQDIAKNEWDYDPNSVSYLSALKRTSLKDLGANSVIDPMQFKRMPNVGLIDTILDDAYKVGKEKAEYTGEVNKLGKRFNVSKVDPVIIQNNLVQRIQNDPEASSAIKTLYARTTGDRDITGEKLTNFIKGLYETKHNYEYVGAPKDFKTSGGGSGSGSGSGDQDKYTYRQQVIQGSLNNDPRFINKMLAALPSGAKIEPLVSVSGKKGAKGGYKSLKITIPESYDTKNNLIPATTTIIEASRGEGAIKLNRILNTYTGDNISDSKLGITGGKTAGKLYEPKVTKGNAPENTTIPTATRSEWKAAGWSESDINEGIKQGVIKIK